MIKIINKTSYYGIDLLYQTEQCIILNIKFYMQNSAKNDIITIIIAMVV